MILGWWSFHTRDWEMKTFCYAAKYITVMDCNYGFDENVTQFNMMISLTSWPFILDSPIIMIKFTVCDHFYFRHASSIKIYVAECDSPFLCLLLCLVPPTNNPELLVMTSITDVESKADDSSHTSRKQLLVVIITDSKYNACYATRLNLGQRVSHALHKNPFTPSVRKDEDFKDFLRPY